MMRIQIDVGMTLLGLMVEMVEGSPGAVSVISKILEKGEDKVFVVLLSLDDMNIRGTQIWLGYKDYCSEDINKFIECALKRDTEMVAKINSFVGDGEIAVVSGASYTRAASKAPWE